MTMPWYGKGCAVRWKSIRLLKSWAKRQTAVVGLTRDLKDYTVYVVKKAGAFDVVDKKDAVVELYDAIQRALAGIDGKPRLKQLDSARA
jgi:DNA-binding NarL/FixJ family response regulator